MIRPIVFIEAVTEAFPQFCFQCIIFKEFGIFKLIQIPKLFMPSINILLCFAKRHAYIKNQEDPGLFTMMNLKYCLFWIIPVTSFFFQISQFAFNKRLSRIESLIPAILVHPCISLPMGWIFHKISKLWINKISKSCCRNLKNRVVARIASICSEIINRILKIPIMFYLQLVMIIPAIIRHSTSLNYTKDILIYLANLESASVHYNIVRKMI